MRVMIRMFTTTYGLSVSSTPMCAMWLPSGPWPMRVMIRMLTTT